ncbi:MAG: 2-oxoacid:acceptor oxidoreductase subunit alpha [Thiohalocapsa sp.]|uniref:2-oxoacid:acceptor oxidoreductase subunit alpha n=1 Tax=Thiohalocapsa sp. TaxID=2497641 RepID=UPI0025EB3859|nr:2-oxoacid:acceptor oxidoreductase subunit alpha [Thiohalocapsa sp.]MCG6941398.1 2-oxoacid:acceptor oxidoreductase subunit alpha [Thiohalocapsa sp.]
MTDANERAAAARTDASLSVAVTGAGGSGAVTAGLILLEAVAAAGLYGLLRRSAGPQIRGGESAALLRFGPEPIHCAGDRCDLLAALDWANHARFADEIPLDAASLVLADPAAGAPPDAVSASAARVREAGFAASAREREGGRANMVAVGAVGALAGLPLEALLDAAGRTLSGKGEAVVAAAHACIDAGFALADPADRLLATVELYVPPPERWHITGNEAAGLGALRAGVRFVAAYPITPASEMLEWLAPRLPRVGGTLLQAEDELASVNMIVGSAFGGVPALTATSGPGLSLMQEGIGLAVASETPIVVVNVMRGGPSTGIPTKAEQSDLNAALYGLHGDAPHLVLAALDIADCAHTVAWAVRLAWRLQTAAIVLSDQSLGQSRAVCDPVSQALTRPARDATELRGPLLNSDAVYRRYAITADGVSPMSVPGEAGRAYTADGLEHDTEGAPSSRAADHAAQLDKRGRKLTVFDFGPDWAEILDHEDGTEADAGPCLCIVTFGAGRGAVVEAAERLRRDHPRVRTIALRLLAPLQRTALMAAMRDARVLVVEQNHGAQLFHYLHAEQALPAGARSLARPGPLPLRPAEIVAAATALLAEDRHDRD